MSIQAILLPVFVQIALTFVLLFWMGFARLGAIRRKEARVADIALGQPNWPIKVQLISNCYANQFQLPLLFYALAVLALVTKTADQLFVIMSWVFVLLRLVHAYIHTGSNFVRYRFYFFVAGGAVLLVMWVVFAAKILLGLS